jgi:hypothetical protein
MRALIAFLVTISTPLLAGDASRLIGVWKLVSWQAVQEDGSLQKEFGAHPKALLVLTREGRSIVVTTAEYRQGGMSDAERVALHKSMLAYSGKYRVERSDFITRVDVSWNEDWNGTGQRRHFRIEGDNLFIESAPAPSILQSNKTDLRRIVWKREK